MSASTWWCTGARAGPGGRWRTSSTAIRERPSPPTLFHEGDGAHRRAVAAFEPEGQRDEAAARRLDLIEVGQVLDHGDPGGKEHVVGRAVEPRHLLAGIKGHGPDRVVGRGVVAHRLGPWLHQPLAGAPARVGRLPPKPLGPPPAHERPVRTPEY